MLKNILIFITTIVLFSKSIFADNKIPLETVTYVSLNKYLGHWYEIAKFPNNFEKKCQYNTTAHYSLIDGENIKVVNKCYAKNSKGVEKIYKSKGTAWVVDKTSNSKLKVSFVPFLNRFHILGGDYWIIELDSDYYYSVVSSADRKYLWILSRTPVLAQDIYDAILLKIKEKGFDITKLEKVIQK